MFDHIQNHIRVQITRGLQSYGVQQQKLLLRVLHEPGNIFSPLKEDETPLAGRWALLTYLMARQLASPFPLSLVSTVAASVECLMCSLDLLDDVEDGEVTDLIQELGVPLVVNAAVTLNGLSRRLLLSIREYGVEDVAIIRFMRVYEEALLEATAGQHIDLLAEASEAHQVSQADCLTLVSMKSASLMRMVCLLGALCTNADDALCASVADFGEHEGMAQQLTNDAHDLYALLHPSHAIFQKSDLVRNKKTLPIIRAAERGYNLLRMPNDEHSRLLYSKIADEEIETTWKLSRMYHGLAYQYLRALSARRPLDAALLQLLHFEPLQEIS